MIFRPRFHRSYSSNNTPDSTGDALRGRPGLPGVAERILVVDTAVALRSTKLHISDPRPVRDGLIAATALIHGMPVVTRNTADFETTDAATLNPWLPR